MEGHFIETIDVDNAYLNGTIEEQYEVYMEQAPGFEIKNPDAKGRRLVCRLKKGLYGLKQSGRLWYQKLASELEAIGFTQIKSDPAKACHECTHRLTWICGAGTYRKLCLTWICAGIFPWVTCTCESRLSQVRSQVIVQVPSIV